MLGAGEPPYLSLPLTSYLLPLILMHMYNLSVPPQIKVYRGPPTASSSDMPRQDVVYGACYVHE